MLFHCMKYWTIQNLEIPVKQLKILKTEWL